VETGDPVAWGVKENSMADNDKPQKKSGAFKSILILLILLLAGGGAGAWYYFFSSLPGSKNAAVEGGDSAKVVVKPATPKATVLTTKEVPPFLVNLADPLGKRYIRLTFQVEINSPEVAAEIDAQQPRIRDSVIMLLSSKSYADLAPMESKLTLQNELVDRINKVLGGPKVTRVFFTDMVIQ
jgi:flagellar FliL protein